jgi:hypothetical protein
MASNLLRPVKDVIEPLRAVLVSLDVGFMAEAVFITDFCGTLIVAKQNDFDIWMEEFPGLQSIALNDSAVALKRFSSGEEGQQSFSPFSRTGARLKE